MAETKYNNIMHGVNIASAIKGYVTNPIYGVVGLGAKAIKSKLPQVGETIGIDYIRGIVAAGSVIQTAADLLTGQYGRAVLTGFVSYALITDIMADTGKSADDVVVSGLNESRRVASKLKGDITDRL